jgi:hypothetical protein
MEYIDYSETGSDTEDKTYTIRIRIKDEYEDISGSFRLTAWKSFRPFCPALGEKRLSLA